MLKTLEWVVVVILSEIELNAGNYQIWSIGFEPTDQVKLHAERIDKIESKHSFKEKSHRWKVKLFFHPSMHNNFQHKYHVNQYSSLVSQDVLERWKLSFPTKSFFLVLNLIIDIIWLTIKVTKIFVKSSLINKLHKFVKWINNDTTSLVYPIDFLCNKFFPELHINKPLIWYWKLSRKKSNSFEFVENQH